MTQAMSEEKQLALLVNHAVDYAIFTMDTAGNVRTWNPGAGATVWFAIPDGAD